MKPKLVTSELLQHTHLQEEIINFVDLQAARWNPSVPDSVLMGRLQLNSIGFYRNNSANEKTKTEEQNHG